MNARPPETSGSALALPRAVEPSRTLGDALARIQDRSITPRPDCRIWVGATDRGYGRISVGGVVMRVHRVVWESVNGPVPDGMELDHICRIRACCNPDHLEAVTHSENVRRSYALRPAMQRSNPRQKRGDECAAGHDLSTHGRACPDGGYVVCRKCELANKRRRRAA